MLKPMSFPRGVLMMFLPDNADEVTVTEPGEHRPDLFLEKPSVVTELQNNYVTNISPISCTKGTSYMMTGLIYRTYFGRSD